MKFEKILNLKNDPQVSERWPYCEYIYAVELQYSIMQGTPWLDLFIYLSKVDINEDFSWDEYVSYRISILNNTMREPISKKTIGTDLFSFNNQAGDGQIFYNGELC